MLNITHPTKETNAMQALCIGYLFLSMMSCQTEGEEPVLFRKLSPEQTNVFF